MTEPEPYRDFIPCAKCGGAPGAHVPGCPFDGMSTRVVFAESREIQEVRDPAINIDPPTEPPSKVTVELQIHEVPCDPWRSRWHLILHRVTEWEEAAYSVGEREPVATGPWRWWLERKRRKLEAEIGEAAVAV